MIAIAMETLHFTMLQVFRLIPFELIETALNHKNIIQLLMKQKAIHDLFNCDNEAAFELGNSKTILEVIGGIRFLLIIRHYLKNNFQSYCKTAEITLNHFLEIL
jgi:hypothetical protein